MRALITTQVFPPEIHPTAVMVGQLATRLVRAGHQVTVACGYPHHPHGRVFAGYRKKLLTCERFDGVNVLRAWHLTSTSRRILPRAGVMLTQAFSTALAGHSAPRPDVVISYGPPLVGPLFSATIARRFRAKLLTVIYDIYPDVAVESGKVTNPLVIGAARVAERWMYRVSDRILVLSTGFRSAMIGKGVPESKIEVVPVWLDADEITPGDRDNPWRAEHGIAPEKFVVLYAGTMGVISGATILTDVAERLASDPDILFLVVGEGDAKVQLQGEAAARRLGNIRFLPPQNRSRLSEVQASADASLVTLAPRRGRTSVPSKVIAYLAAGRPVVASVDADSDTARCVASADAGLVTRPGDAAGLAEAIRTLKSDAGLRTSMGTAARAAFEHSFTSAAALTRYEAILRELAPEPS